jgi:N-methylhydantoinase B
VDAITLAVLSYALNGVAEEMSAALVRTAFSPNIKERRDCSSAVFDEKGLLVAQAENIPVHLGAMPFSVSAALSAVKDWDPEDVVVLNDPYHGGAHLPDITFVAPVFWDEEIIGFVACRAHHADVGGMTPGSLPPEAKEIYQEGLRIPPVKLWRQGRLDQDLWTILLANVRTPLGAGGRPLGPKGRDRNGQTPAERACGKVRKGLSTGRAIAPFKTTRRSACAAPFVRFLQELTSLAISWTKGLK